MGWDVAVFGRLALGAAALGAWRDMDVSARRWRDWKAWFRRAPAASPRTVAQALAAWERRNTRGRELFEVAVGPRGVTVAGYLSKDVFLEEARDLVSIFRCAEAVGATGAITFVLVGQDEAYRLTLDEGGSAFELLADDHDTRPEVRRLVRRVVARDEATAAARVTRRASRVPPDELREEGREATPNEGIEAAGVTDVKLLYEALEVPALVKTPAGYASPTRVAAARALASTGRPEILADLLARLTPAACTIPAGPTGSHVAPTKQAYARHTYVEALLLALGEARYRPAWDRLADVVRTSPLESVRLLAIEALARMAEPHEIEGALGESAAAFHKRAFGMGVFGPARPEVIGRKLIAYVKRTRPGPR